MPQRSSVPRYLLHKASGQARVRVQGRDHYLGVYNSPESHERYARIVAEISQSHTTPSVVNEIVVADPQLCINELVLQYLRYAHSYYGEQAKESTKMRDALRFVCELYGNEKARNFGPLSLKAVRQKLIESGICRNEINRRISRIKRVFKWAVSEQLIPPTVLEGLKSVTGLQRGRSQAQESKPVKPVDPQIVEQTLPFLSPPVAAICRLQLLTGMRPSEITQMRPQDIDRSEEIWIYRPATHKTQYLGFDKQVPLGPQAQAVLQEFMDRPEDAYLFTPREAMEWQNQQKSQHRKPARKTKVYPSELKARERSKAKSRKRSSQRVLQPKYNAVSLRRAIYYGQLKAKKQGVEIPHWFPYQIRHTHGTEVRKKYGLEAAQVMLGHASADVTQVYAERNLDLAMKVAREIG